MYWNGHMTAGGWIVSIIGTLLILALVIGAIVVVVQALGSRSGGGATTSSSARSPSAREILDRRLASGEVTIEQYNELCDAIGETSAKPSPTKPPLHPADAST